METMEYIEGRSLVDAEGMDLHTPHFKNSTKSQRRREKNGREKGKEGKGKKGKRKTQEQQNYKILSKFDDAIFLYNMIKHFILFCLFI